jgi:hypothetical protein
LAAQIIKHYVLPMFSDNTMTPSSKNRRTKQPSSRSLNQRALDELNPKTVIGGLKLTDALANQLQDIKDRHTSMNIEMEKIM